MSGLGRRSHYRKHLADSILNDYPEPAQNERIAKVVGTRGSNQFDVVVSPSIQESNSGNDVENNNLNTTPQLALLPSKFRKLVWVKRNDYVICSCAQSEDLLDEKTDGSSSTTIKPLNPSQNSSTTVKSTEGGIRYMITHILYKDQVKHLKDENKWPLHPFFEDKNIDLKCYDKNKESDTRANVKNAVKVKEQESHKSGQSVEKKVATTNDRYDDEESECNEDVVNDNIDGIVYQNDYDDNFLVNTNRIAKIKICDSSSEEDSD